MFRMSIAHLFLICLIPIAVGNELSQSNNAFANELYQHLARPSENLLFSPLGVYSMLALTYEATSGQTEKMMNIAVNFANKKDVAEQYKELITFLNQQKANVNLRLVNKVFMETAFKFVRKFQNIASSYFKTNTSSLRFSDTQEVNKEVNAWFNDETNGHIHDFDEIGDVSRLTTIMMLNALYFKAAWKLPFYSKPDVLDSFYLTQYTVMPAEFMRRVGMFEYYESEDLDAKCLKVDFKNWRFSATFILPNTREGIEDVEYKLQEVNISDINNLMETKEVEVAIPHFEIESVIDLEKSLRAIGLGALFDRDDITDMSDGNLRMGKIMQKALIGMGRTVVTASAGVANDEDDIPMYTFIANHPFIFTININMDSDEDSLDVKAVEYVVLFMGKVCSPIN